MPSHDAHDRDRDRNIGRRSRKSSRAHLRRPPLSCQTTAPKSEIATIGLDHRRVRTNSLRRTLMHRMQYRPRMIAEAVAGRLLTNHRTLWHRLIAVLHPAAIMFCLQRLCRRTPRLRSTRPDGVIANSRPLACRQPNPHPFKHQRMVRHAPFKMLRHPRHTIRVTTRKKPSRYGAAQDDCAHQRR
jgi:hypothetical protein